MKLTTFWGSIMTIVVLSIGLASISGCSTTVAQGAPVTLTTSQPPVIQTTSQAPVTLTTSQTPVIQTTSQAPVIQTTTQTPVIQTTSQAPVIQTTTQTPVIPTTPIPTLLANIRSKAEQPSPGIYYVDAVTAKNLVDSTQAIFMDARYLVDYDAAHIPGAISVPVSSVWLRTLEPETILPNKEAVLIAYCAPGCPAGLELTQELSVRGYHNLFVLNGGYLAWENAGYAMDKQKPKP